jgi:colanic acid biosynthesis glycosyl transferase WcaI
MRILFLNQYFPPEITAGANRAHAFATELARRGHEVEVICEVPSHPAGVVAPGYGGRLVQRERLDGVEVNYVWVRASPKKSLAARLANYGSYAATAALVGLRAGRPDVILASLPPPTVGSVAKMLSRRHRVPWVLDVRDLWTEAAVVLGQVEEGALVRATRRLVRRLYADAAVITTTTRPFADAIESQGGAGKVTVIPNGTTQLFLDVGKSPRERSRLGGSGDDEVFTWSYAGNIGLVAGLESAIEAARQLGEGFRLTLVGDGQRRDQLRALAEELPEGSVRFLDPVPPGEAAVLMRASDALLVSRAPNPGLDAMVLAKLYDCCAVGRPVVVSAAGETSRLAEESGAALCVPPGDPAALAAAIRTLRDDPSLRERLENGGRAFAEENTRERGVELLERILTRTAEGA